MNHESMEESLSDSCHLQESLLNDVNSNVYPRSCSSQLTETIVSSRYGSALLIQIGLKELATCTSTKPFDGVKQVILLIPGNPGIISFYTTVIQKLYQETKIPVIGLSHPGLSKDLAPSAEGPMTCRMQVQHKLDFIEKHIPSDVKLILVGHSIGGFMAVEIMKGIADRDQILHSILLMPALNDLRSSIGATFFAVGNFFRVFIYLFVFIVSLFPEKFMLNCFKKVTSLFVNDVDEDSLKGLYQLFSIKAVSNSLALGRDEMKQVAERDNLFIRQNLSKVSFVYAAVDEWIPIRFVDDLKEEFPSADVTVLQGVVHAFMMDKTMGSDVLRILTSKLQPFTETRKESTQND
jgi:pimeloyl-ACP methyl ester carboxylesterase